MNDPNIRLPEPRDPHRGIALLLNPDGLLIDYRETWDGKIDPPLGPMAQGDTLHVWQRLAAQE